MADDHPDQSQSTTIQRWLLLQGLAGSVLIVGYLFFAAFHLLGLGGTIVVEYLYIGTLIGTVLAVWRVSLSRFFKNQESIYVGSFWGGMWGLSIFGLGTYLLGNFLNNFALQHGCLSPNDPLMVLLFFFDEIFGHVLLFTGILGICVTVGYQNRGLIIHLSSYEWMALAAEAVCAGTGAAVAMIEGNYTFWALTILLTSWPIGLWIWHRSSPIKRILGSPVWIFFGTATISFLVVSIGYWLFVGRFWGPPSALLGMLFPRA